MSDKKYLRLAGFNPDKARELKTRNQKISERLLSMCMEAQRMLLPHNGQPGLAGIRIILDEILKEGLAPKHVLRACYRLKLLLPDLETGKCIIGRNNFLDVLNIKQIVWYRTGINTASTVLGCMSREWDK
ncbi:MAG: hypothetical protein DI626_08950 [Micavibrio aeruginosavorus]|uniref:Uncharacterized protein n=1 Tax=Micavibrio aeruginosavorus TaxID=349221 RepID=A0A2W4ZQM0_9BACT|nr:MAG: hypothetical protein DI626_08950 [Micavibrio aeruginosavorus]